MTTTELFEYLKQRYTNFTDEHASNFSTAMIDGSAFLSLTADDFKDLGLPLGTKKNCLTEITLIKELGCTFDTNSSIPNPLPKNEEDEKMEEDENNISQKHEKYTEENEEQVEIPMERRRNKSNNLVNEPYLTTPSQEVEEDSLFPVRDKGDIDPESKQIISTSSSQNSPTHSSQDSGVECKTTLFLFFFLFFFSSFFCDNFYLLFFSTFKKREKAKI
jgi:hypothetical protein